MEYSVIILIFHRTPELVEMAKNCVASVLNTIDREESELIIVDNGSTVKSDYWYKADQYIRLPENMGISVGWNTGLKAAKGKYKIILGDDTILHGNWIEELRKCFDEPHCGVANLQMEHLPHGKGIVENYKWPSGACFMLTQEVIDKVGYFDENIFPCNWEDLDMWLRIYQAGLKMYRNYHISIQHLEGQTVHAPDLSAGTERNHQYVIKKFGFDPHDTFFGNESIYKMLNTSSKLN